jgi:hypothetical protein
VKTTITLAAVGALALSLLACTDAGSSESGDFAAGTSGNAAASSSSSDASTADAAGEAESSTGESFEDVYWTPATIRELVVKNPSNIAPACKELCGLGSRCVGAWSFQEGGEAETIQHTQCDFNQEGLDSVRCWCADETTYQDATVAMSPCFFSGTEKTETTDAIERGPATCQDYCDQEGLGECLWTGVSITMCPPRVADPVLTDPADWCIDVETGLGLNNPKTNGQSYSTYHFGCAR